MTTTFDVSPVRVGKSQVNLPLLSVVAKGFQAQAQAGSEHLAVRSRHGLHDAVWYAYANHLPLALSPDHVWLTIERELAQHVANNAERLRSRFVQFEGKRKLDVRRDHFVRGSPDNDWAGCFDEWAVDVRANTNPMTYKRLVCDFSTTGPLERAISHVTLLSALSHYFDYSATTLCGIPRITLEGTPEDWQRLYVKASVLAEYEMDWWTEHLLPVLEQFVSAASGKIDGDWWQGFYKEKDESGGPYINGHIVALFAHTREWEKEGWVPRSRWALPPRAFGGLATTRTILPSLVAVPFVWHYLGEDIPMGIIGGQIGFTVAGGTVRPASMWAIREGEGR